MFFAPAFVHMPPHAAFFSDLSPRGSSCSQSTQVSLVALASLRPAFWNSQPFYCFWQVQLAPGLFCCSSPDATDNFETAMVEAQQVGLGPRGLTVCCLEQEVWLIGARGQDTAFVCLVNGAYTRQKMCTTPSSRFCLEPETSASGGMHSCLHRMWRGVCLLLCLLRAMSTRSLQRWLLGMSSIPPRSWTGK